MKTKTLLLLVFAIFIMTACKKERINEKEIIFKPRLIPLVLTAQGNLLGNGSEGIPGQNIVIKNEAEWNDLITKMDSSEKVTKTFTETKINFEHYQILAVFSGIKTSDGHSIDIISITENLDNIKVLIDRVLKGGPNSVFTQPYHIVKIPKSEKEVIFENL